MHSDLIEGSANIEQWLLREPFVLSRGSRTHAEVVYLALSDGNVSGHSECQPNARYNETAEEVVSQLTKCFPASLAELEELAQTLPSYAARNALDCAVWDFKVKRGICSLPNLPGRKAGSHIPTYYTLSVAAPEDMAAVALRVYEKGCRRLKLKFAGSGDDERLAAVRSVAPDASIIIDANEAWSENLLEKYLPLLEKNNVDLLEQPLPVGADTALADIETPIVICADESCHTAADVQRLIGKYDAVNIKLDKAGGLTPAVALLKEAQNADLKVMVGCMLGTSLAIAPAFLPATYANYIDLDAPLLLGEDRQDGYSVNRSFVFEKIHSPLWG